MNKPIKKAIFEHIIILNTLNESQIDTLLDNGLTMTEAMILGDDSVSVNMRKSIIKKYLG